MYSWKSFLRVSLKVRGANFNVLIDELKKRNIKFKAQRVTDTELNIETTENNLPVLFDLLRNKCYNYSISYKSEIGLPKILGVVIGLAFCLIVFMVLSNFCLGVQINTDDAVLSQKIQSVLTENSWGSGKSWGSLDFDEIELNLLTHVEELSMVNVSRFGAYLIVNVNEGTLPGELNHTEENTQGIFASADGVVSRIFVASGTALVKVGDTVSFGQMLVAPYRETAEGEQIPTIVKADVYLYLWDSETVEFRENTYEFSRTGNFVVSRDIAFAGNVLKSENANVNFEHYETEILTYNISNILPLKMICTYYFETTAVPVKKEFSAERDSLIYEAKQKLLQKIDKTQILEEKYTISQIGEVYYVTYYTKREIKV